MQNLSEAAKLLLNPSNKLTHNWFDASIVDGKLQVTGLPVNAKRVNAKNYKTHPARAVLKFAGLVKKITGCDENVARAFNEAFTGLFNQAKNAVEVVTGEAIRYWYQRGGEQSGSVVSSCMTYTEALKYLDFYIYNPDTVQLAVVIEDGLIKARSILITGHMAQEDAILGKNPVKLQGRIYGTNDAKRAQLRAWGEKNGYALLSGGQAIINGRAHTRWFVAPKIWRLNYYPYMDHFPYIDKKTHLWTNVPSTSTVSVGRGVGLTAEEDPTLDPFRPSLIWYNGKWCEQPEDVEWVPKKGWRKKVIMVECIICNTRVTSNGTVRGKINPKIKDIMSTEYAPYMCYGHTRNNDIVEVFPADGGRCYYAPKKDAHTCLLCKAKIPKENQYCHYCNGAYRVKTKEACPKCKLATFKNGLVVKSGNLMVCKRHKTLNHLYCRSCKVWHTECVKIEKSPKITKVKVNI
jgi:hypothetical protein